MLHADGVKCGVEESTESDTPNFTPVGAGWGVDPQKLQILRNYGINLRARAYPSRSSDNIFTICEQFYGRLIHPYFKFGGICSRRSGVVGVYLQGRICIRKAELKLSFLQNFKRSLAVKLYVGSKKSYRSANKYELFYNHYEYSVA